MDMKKIRTIIDKEWAEVFQNKMVFFVVLFLPLFFTLLPLIMLWAMLSTGSTMTSDIPPEALSMCAGNLTGSECLYLMIISEIMMLFMMTPVIIPVTISAYSIVGEKTTHCLEPLLATPITTMELILGKGLAAAIPAVVATWGSFIVFLIGARIIVQNDAFYQQLLSPMWLVAVLLVGPLMAFIAVIVTIMVSSRVNDPRAAEQISMLLILPILGLFFSQIAGLVMLNLQLMLICALVLLIINIGLAWWGTKIFQRETILTQWK